MNPPAIVDDEKRQAMASLAMVEDNIVFENNIDNDSDQEEEEEEERIVPKNLSLEWSSDVVEKPGNDSSSEFSDAEYQAVDLIEEKRNIRTNNSHEEEEGVLVTCEELSTTVVIENPPTSDDDSSDFEEEESPFDGVVVDENDNDDGIVVCYDLPPKDDGLSSMRDKRPHLIANHS